MSLYEAQRQAGKLAMHRQRMAEQDAAPVMRGFVLLVEKPATGREFREGHLLLPPIVADNMARINEAVTTLKREYKCYGLGPWFEISPSQKNGRLFRKVDGLDVAVFDLWVYALDTDTKLLPLLITAPKNAEGTAF